VADQQDPTFAEAFQLALGKAGFARVKPGEMPSGKDLIAAVGGIRGLVESILPGLAFLVAFSVSNIVLKSPDYLIWSVGVPVILCVVFVVARVVARQPLRSALTGVVIAALTAGLALITGRAQDSFLPGIIINSVSLVVFLVSIAVRWPLIGLIAGALTNDLTGWRSDRAKRKVLTIASWLWVGLFAIRLGIELPLYFASLTDWLAGAKLLLGAPFYALLLWVTWLLLGTVFASAPVAENGDDARA
jgi:hypothetical protein